MFPLLVVTVPPAVRRAALLSLSLLAALALARLGSLAGRASVPATGTPRPLRGVAVSDQRLALTFDVTRGERVPARVLDVLRAQGVRATFFVTGTWAAAHPDLVRRLVAEGHELGSYGDRHLRLSRYPRQVVREEILRAQERIAAVSGRRPTLLRPPDGAVDDAVMAAAGELGCTVVLWGTDAQDWATPGPDYVVRRVLAHAHPGDIVRMTADDAAVDTPDALVALLPALARKGFRVVPVGGLLGG